MTTPAPLHVSLTSIATHWHRLLEPLTSSGGGGVVSGSKDVALPGGTGRISLAKAIAHQLAYWGYAVKDQHACARAPIDAHDVPAVARWLIEHTPWIEAQNDGPEAVATIDELSRALERTVEPSKIRRTPVGPCPQDGCEGTVRARLGADGDGTDAGRDLTCDADATHAWDESRWRDLGRLLGDEAPARMRPEALAAWMSERFRRPINAAMIRKWAHRHAFFPSPADDGTYDRVAVAEWYIERAATQAA